MEKELEKLWYSYLIEEVSKKCDKETNLIRKLSADESALRSKLNEEEIELLEKYDASVNEMCSLSEKHAFIKGVRFTVRFFIEALCE